MKSSKKITIGIVGGRGILGKVFQRNFEAAGIKVLISGRKPDGQKVLSTKKLLEKSDIVIVSVFLKSTEKVLHEIVPKMHTNQLLVDFTSVKKIPLEIMRAAKSEVVGLHPMFGDVQNLRGKNIFACNVRGGKLWKVLRKILEDFGLKIHEISAKKHDELAAVHQSAVHLLNLAFAEILRQSKISPAEIFEIASPSTQLFLLTAGRILDQDLKTYADIQLENPAAKKSAAMLAKILQKLAEEIDKKSRRKLLLNFETSAKFFGKWSHFASAESSRIFENLTKEDIPKIAPSEIRIKKTKRKQKMVDFAVLGQNTQTQLAMLRFAAKIGLIGNKNQEITITFHKEGFSPKSTIAKVFEAVKKREAKLGFIPLENYSIGPVRETMKQLFEANGEIKIWGEFTHEIHHALVGRKDSSKDINTIFAHPQAHAQCDRFLRKNYPKVNLIPVTNAEEAIKLAAENSDALAIGPSGVIPSQFKGILVPKEDKIEDDKNNLTRFIAISKSSDNRKLPISSYSKKTAIAFFFPENKAGQLAAALNIFTENKINLSRIESIPTTKKRGEFFFFVEAERSKDLPAALTKLRKIANTVELGNY